MKAPSDSSVLSFDDGIIAYRSKHYGSWRMPVDSVRLVGEYTTTDGPFVDDYFFVFVARPVNEWKEASFYSEGRDDFLRKPGQIFPDLCGPSLADSTTFKSRVLWPIRHIDKPLFVTTESSADIKISPDLD